MVNVRTVVGLGTTFKEKDMQEFDQYRIELTGKEAEEIVKEHMTNLLAEKGYTLDYSMNEGGFPESTWRGVKMPNV